MTVYQLTIAMHGVLTNFYFNGYAEGEEARVHADVAGCIFLFGKAGSDLDVPFCSINSPIDFIRWLSNTRQGA